MPQTKECTTHTHMHIPPCNVVHSRGYPGKPSPVWGLKWHKTLFVCLDLLSSSPSLPSALSGVGRTRPFIPPSSPPSPSLSGDAGYSGDAEGDFASHNFPHGLSSLEVGRVELLSGEPESVGAGRRGTVGVLHSSWFGFMREFAQIVYSSLGFEWFWLDLGFWKLIKAAENQYSMSLFP